MIRCKDGKVALVAGPAPISIFNTHTNTLCAPGNGISCTSLVASAVNDAARCVLFGLGEGISCGTAEVNFERFNGKSASFPCGFIATL